ncbi:PQQ-binding-like beta-propeller repeat protein [Massilia sp. SR12]
MRILHLLFLLALVAPAARSMDAASPPKLEHAIELRAQTVSSPVIAQGKLYIGAEDGNLYAFDLATRKLAWLYHAGAGVASTPAVADGVVYAMARDGRLHAVDAHTGVQRWEFARRAASLQDPWDFWFSSPLVAGGRVYVGSPDQNMYALDAATGAVQWAYKSGGAIHAAPALAGKTLVFGSWDGAVYALEAATGKQLWRHQSQPKADFMIGVQAAPLIDGDTVYIGARDAWFYALELASGKVKWRYNGKGSWFISGAVADAGKVYVGTSDTNLLVALDKQSGQPIFEHDSKVWTYTKPVLAGGMVIGASMRGELFALDAASGKARWSWRTAESQADVFGLLDKASGKFDGKRLYEGPHSVRTSIEQVKRLGAFISSPLWHEGQLVAATADGRLLYFR